MCGGDPDPLEKEWIFDQFNILYDNVFLHVFPLLIHSLGKKQNCLSQEIC